MFNTKFPPPIRINTAHHKTVQQCPSFGTPSPIYMRMCDKLDSVLLLSFAWCIRRTVLEELVLHCHALAPVEQQVGSIRGQNQGRLSSGTQIKRGRKSSPSSTMMTITTSTSSLRREPRNSIVGSLTQVEQSRVVMVVGKEK